MTTNKFAIYLYEKDGTLEAYNRLQYKGIDLQEHFRRELKMMDSETYVKTDDKIEVIDNMQYMKMTQYLHNGKIYEIESDGKRYNMTCMFPLKYITPDVDMQSNTVYRIRDIVRVEYESAFLFHEVELKK